MNVKGQIFDNPISCSRSTDALIGDRLHLKGKEILAEQASFEKPLLEDLICEWGIG